MVLFILILNYLGPSGFNIVIAVTFASAPAIMRIVRGLTLDMKTRDYIFAAQTRGERPLRIMIVELLPNVRGPLIVDACLRLGYTTVAITTLTFLGLGLQPPDPDWGLMIKEAANDAMVWKFSYMLLIPALSVSSLILGFNLHGRRPARDEPERLMRRTAPGERMTARAPTPGPRVPQPLHLLLHARRRNPGGRRFQPEADAGRGARDRRRVGLRQVHRGARHHAVHGQERRASSAAKSCSRAATCGP